MSEEQLGSKTRHGRLIKKPGMDAKKIEALEKMKALKAGSLNPLDQYQVSLPLKKLSFASREIA